MTIALLDYPKVKIRMMVDGEPEQQYRIRACEKEPWTVKFIEDAAAESPGANFKDVGANVGPYTLIALANGLRVTAIEPGHANYHRLMQNLELNGLDDAPIYVFPGALGEVVGFRWLHYSDLRPGAASHLISDERQPKYVHRQRVNIQTLDSLAGIEPPPWYLKIDVDGGEVEVLKGGAATLSSEYTFGVCIEMALPLEAECTALLNAAGMVLTERFQPRNSVCYGIFRRDGVPVVPGTVTYQASPPPRSSSN